MRDEAGQQWRQRQAEIFQKRPGGLDGRAALEHAVLLLGRRASPPLPLFSCLQVSSIRFSPARGPHKHRGGGHRHAHAHRNLAHGGQRRPPPHTHTQRNYRVCVWVAALPPNACACLPPCPCVCASARGVASVCGAPFASRRGRSGMKCRR